MLERWGRAVPAGGGGAAAHRLCGSAAGGGGGTAIGNRRRTPTARCRRGLAALQQLQNQSPARGCGRTGRGVQFSQQAGENKPQKAI